MWPRGMFEAQTKKGAAPGPAGVGERGPGKGRILVVQEGGEPKSPLGLAVPSPRLHPHPQGEDRGSAQGPLSETRCTRTRKYTSPSPRNVSSKRQPRWTCL